MDQNLRELKEDMARERWLQLWKQYGRWVAGAAALFVLGTAGKAAWHWTEQQERLKDAEIFARAEAMDKSGDSAGAAAALLDLANKNSGYAQIAALEAAKLYSSSDQIDKAEAAWKIQDNRAGGEPFLRSAANLYGAEARLARHENTPIAPSEGDPMSSSLKELQALQLLDRAKVDEASRLFAELAAQETVPATLQGRAREMEAALKSELKPSLPQVPAAVPPANKDSQ